MASACVLLAEGFEEIEAITVIDVLRRAEVEVTTAGLAKRNVKGAHGIKVVADTVVAELGERPFDLLYLPGGLPGAHNLRDDAGAQALVKRHAEADKRVAAICAGPIALESAGVLAGKRATSYPGFGEQLSSISSYLEEPVVVDGNVTTSRGPGTASDLALNLVEQLCGTEKAGELREKMLWG